MSHFWIAMLIAFVATGGIYMLLRHTRYSPSADEVADLIEKRMANGISKEWDYFRLVTIRDKHLDNIRKRCLALDYAPPEERERQLMQIVEELRSKLHSGKNS